MTDRKDRDYYLDKAVNIVIEYVKKKDGIEWIRQDRLKYKSILMNDEEFHVYAFFKYGLLINYDNNIDELDIGEVRDKKGNTLPKESYPLIKFGVYRFGSLKEFLKTYSEFKNDHTNLKDIREINKAFRKEFGIPDRVPIPADLDNLIKSRYFA